MKSDKKINSKIFDYEEVPKCENLDEKSINSERKNSWIPFLRQALVCSGIWVTYFQAGLTAGTPTVLIPQVRREANSTDAISLEQASWLSSISAMGSIPWIPLITATAWYFGRRVAHGLAVASSLAGYAAFYFNTKYEEFCISLIVLALNGSSLASTALLIMTEFTAPGNRGFFLTLKSATLYWGVWAANAIGTFSHWRNIQVLGFCCAVYNALTLLAWPESPYWLASQGRIHQCRRSFVWLRGGINKRNEKELNDLMKFNNHENVGIINRSHIHEFRESVCSKWFYKTMFLCFLAVSQYFLTGKIVISVYAIDIVKKITNSESKAYAGMLILDGVTVFGMYGGCFLARYMTRRGQLLLGTSVGVICMLLMSLYLYLIKLSFTSENVYVSLLLLSTSTLFISCGPVLLSVTLMGELLPLRQRNFCVLLVSIFAAVLSGVLIKTALTLFMSLGLHGAFLFYGLSSTVCLMALYRYLPETKDKTLLEISQKVVDMKL